MFLWHAADFFRVVCRHALQPKLLDSIGGFQMRYLTVIVSLFCVLFTADAAKADRRVAFVVGNGTYKNVAQLPNPPIDAKAMAATLRNVGFEVIEGSNLSRDQMTEKLLDFGRFQFEQSKRQRESSKAQKGVALKEIRFRPNVGEHDVATKVHAIKEFLEAGNKVKVVVRMRACQALEPDWTRSRLSRG